MSGLWPVRLMWSDITMSVPGPNDGSSPPAALVSTTILAPSGMEQQHRLDDEARVVALVEVEAALEHHDGRPGERAQQQAPGMPRGGRGRPAGQVRERDRDRVLQVVGQAAQPGAQDDPDRRDQRRSLPDRGDRAASRAGWSSGWMGSVGSTGSDMRASRIASRG